MPETDPAPDELDDDAGDPTAPDTGDLVAIDPDHQGDEDDPPRDAADADDPLDDIDEGEIVPAEELSD